MKVNTLEERRNPKRKHRLQKKLHCGLYENRCFEIGIPWDWPESAKGEDWSEVYERQDKIFDAFEGHKSLWIGTMSSEKKGMEVLFTFASGSMAHSEWIKVAHDCINKIKEVTGQDAYLLVNDFLFKDTWYDF